MELQQLLHEKHIAINLNVSSREECIKQLASRMETTGVVINIEDYTACVLRREHEGTTGVGFKVAIPHGKASSVVKPGLAFAKLASPVDWESLDGEPVEYVFMIAVPEAQAGNEHLQILAALSRKLMHDEFRNKLASLKTTSDVYDLLKS
ncbi:PTS fructose transporter subunit IIA [Bacillus sp. HMF5848]|uniref:PTS sugar transporter subunit IIA n=1 Tax=Bacillus sp. HMF5848 TaxID=2495421 RepID=UPI000F7666CF|nr:fructose PTS transporter subunit IIA [Bacillus sp. HMF5848]RSK26790.1 PTS fructose transporter subunit IIA [Bacillus sp. HMF5848]